MAKLSPKQKLFVDEYLIDLNAKQAAIRAGYSAKTAERSGPRVLCSVVVQSVLAERIAEREKRTEINADYVLKRLAEIDQMDCLDILNDNGSVKPISKWPKIWRQFISGLDIADIFEGSGEERELVGLLKKIKWPDKLKNLELLGKHVSVQAFKEKMELTGDVRIEVTDARERVLAKLLPGAT